MDNKSFICSWSGGKDSCLAFYKAYKGGYDPKALITAFIEDGSKSRSHGIDAEIIKEQAMSLGVESEAIYTSWNDYEFKFIDKLKEMKDNLDISTAVFGDIDLQIHLDWEEMVCKKASLKPLLPLWQLERRKILNDFLTTGFKTMIVAVNSEKLSNKYLGCVLDDNVIENLVKDGSDACGENGEFHTVVIDGPIFSYPIKLKTGEIYSHSGYSFIKSKIERP